MRKYLDPIHPRFDLCDAFNDSECAVCVLGRRSVERYLAAINDESVADARVRQHFRDAGGFCNVHAYQWLSRGFVLETASLYHELLQALASKIGAHQYHAQSFVDRFRTFMDEMLTGATSKHQSERCPVCAWLAQTESMLLITLVTSLDEPDFRSAYLASVGLCVPHLERAMHLAHREDIFTLLQDHARTDIECLTAQITEIIEKYGHQDQQALPDDEGGIVARAVAQIIGFRGRTDGEKLR